MHVNSFFFKKMHKIKVKKIVLSLLIILLMLVGCKNAVPIDIYQNLGEETFSYPDWFTIGHYYSEKYAYSELIFEKNSFEYKLIYTKLKLPAKKVLLRILDENTFTLEICTQQSCLKFEIEKIPGEEGKIKLVEYYKSNEWDGGDYWGIFALK